MSTLQPVNPVSSRAASPASAANPASPASQAGRASLTLQSRSGDSDHSPRLRTQRSRRALSSKESSPAISVYGGSTDSTGRTRRTGSRQDGGSPSADPPRQSTSRGHNPQPGSSRPTSDGSGPTRLHRPDFKDKGFYVGKTLGTCLSPAEKHRKPRSGYVKPGDLSP